MTEHTNEQYLEEDEPTVPVFLDRSGRRWPRVRRGFAVLGVFATLLMLAFVASFLVPPLLPTFRPAEPGVTPRFVGTRQARIRRARKEQLYAAVEMSRTATSIQHAARALGRAVEAASGGAPRPIRVGFYLAGIDNSLASFREHYDDLDWVVCQWGFLNRTGDTVRVVQDTAFFGVYDSVPSHPKVLLMVSNADSATQRFSGAAVRAMVATPQSRAQAQAQILAAIEHYKLAGVTIDFEEIPPDAMTALIGFEADLHRTLAAKHLLMTQAVSVSTNPADLRRFALVNDYLFLMLYDEHYGKGDPGPVASQAWFDQNARTMLRDVPRNKAIFGIGAYGYDWNDAGPAASGESYTFQEVLAKGRDNPATSQMGFDRTSLNPYMRWTDPDSTDHIVWYLDAASGYNEVQIERRLGAAGYAVWRLGSEDPALWSTIATDNVRDAANAFAEVPPGYETEFIGDGEILQIVASPRTGSRVSTIDTVSGMFTGERIRDYPSPYIIRKYGKTEHEVALTFDDGPDGRWTPMILDTLASRHATATFFVIGRNVEAHLPLVRRIVADGNLVGNHTFTHPNLALTSNWVTKLEIDANQRLLEAVLNRRSFFFRPPYFGDAEPTTNDELVPVDIASKRGYVTVGLHIDAED